MLNSPVSFGEQALPLKESDKIFSYHNLEKTLINDCLDNNAEDFKTRCQDLNPTVLGHLIDSHTYIFCRMIVQNGDVDLIRNFLIDGGRDQEIRRYFALMNVALESSNSESKTDLRTIDALLSSPFLQIWNAEDRAVFFNEDPSFLIMKRVVDKRRGLGDLLSVGLLSRLITAFDTPDEQLRACLYLKNEMDGNFIKWLFCQKLPEFAYLLGPNGQLKAKHRRDLKA